MWWAFIVMKEHIKKKQRPNPLIDLNRIILQETHDKEEVVGNLQMLTYSTAMKYSTRRSNIGSAYSLGHVYHWS